MSDTRPGLLTIISGPSGVGKTTITHRVKDALGGVFSVSMTTRPPAPGERPGIDYHFVDRETFEHQRDAGRLLEWAEVFDACYGTPREPVERCLDRGGLMILEIDVAGAEQVKARMPEAFALFVLPPSEEALLRRLRDRRREDEAAIERRFAKAREEIRRAEAGDTYDAFVVNDDVERALAETLDHVRAAWRRRAGAGDPGQ